MENKQWYNHCLFSIRSQLVYIYCRMLSVQNVIAAECRRCRMWWVGVNWCVYDESVKINDHCASMMSRWWVGDESVLSRWWIGDESVMGRWWMGDESVKIGDASMMSRWLVGDKSVKIDDQGVSMMSRWWIIEHQWSYDASMMSQWWIGNESGDELVKIDYESVISRWKLMMRRWVSAEMVMSRFLFRNSRISRYQGRISLNLLS